MTAEEILSVYLNVSTQDCSTPRQDLQLALTLNPSLDKIESAMIEYTRFHVEQALKAASEQVVVKVSFYGWGKEADLDGSEYSADIQAQSILDAYPLENIK